ncbi:MAG: hypothetical protein Q8935_14275 [Bacillota bacterium]|nr:hypothetical protein [Bacillota bacterium]
MSDNTEKQKIIHQINGETCDLTQKQARMEMKKEDERKQISKMMEKL